MSYIKIKDESAKKDVWINTNHIVMIGTTQDGKKNQIFLSRGDSPNTIVTSLTIEKIFDMIKKSV